MTTRRSRAAAANLDLFAPRGLNGEVFPLVDLIDASGDCWLWTGRVERNGYGRVYVGRQKWSAHRLIWWALVGPIPDKAVIDHMCRVRHCVNPDHMRVVTQAINNDASPAVVTTINKRKTKCCNGHPFDSTNTGIRNTQSGGRQRFCRTCRRAQRKRAS